MSDDWDAHDRRMAEREERIRKAEGPFRALLPHWLRLDRGDVWGRRKSVSVATRLEEAIRALREWRYANQQDCRLADEVAVSVLIVADSMASEIAAAADARQDQATIAWVVAGLRCQRRPFCQGCDSCFTIAAPHRADVQFH